MMSTTESKWLNLNSDVIAPPIAPTDANWAKESPSLYDVPTHIRSYYNADTGILTIELKYIAEEELVDCTIEPYAQLSLGRKTRRIHALRFNVHQFSRDRKKIAEETEGCIERLPEQKAPTREITLRAIRSQERTLFDAVA